MTNSKFIFILGVSILSILSSCSKKPCGSGSDVTQELSVSPFNAVKNTSVAQATISEGTPSKVEVTGYSYVIENNLDVSVSNQVLNLAFLDIRDYCSNDYSRSHFDIKMPSIGSIEQTGAGNLILNDFQNQGDITLLNTGSGSISINKITGTQNLTATLKGTGSIMANQNLDSLQNTTIVVEGTGSFKAFPIQTKNCTVTIKGTGDCEIFVKNTLTVNIQGTGSVYYKGNPTIIQNITGNGKLINAN